MTRVLVVGNGPAAHRLTERLHHHGHRGRVTVLGAEPHPAYQRVLLPSVLAGGLPPEALLLPPHPAGTRVLPGVTATGIDRRRRVVRASDGAEHAYDTLVLATGAAPVVPAVPGLRAPDGQLARGVRTVRTLADTAALPSGRVVVLGGGVLGVETALALRGAGHAVALVHPHAHLAGHLLDPAAGRMLADRMTDLGVTLHLGAGAAEYVPGKLLLREGPPLPADALLLCAGVAPGTGPARGCGLAVRTGVVVDDRLTTNDPRIHAIGDCAEHAGQVPGVLSAGWEQADVLARVLTGHDARHAPRGRAVRLRSAEVDLLCVTPPPEPGGAADGGHTVTFSDPAGRRYARLHLRGDRIASAVLLGLPRAIAAVGQLHDSGSPVPSDRLALLLGARPAARPAPAASADAVVCACNNVTGRTLLDAVAAGARDTAALARATRATTGCGTCLEPVRRLLAAATPAGAGGAG
ncbi:FAD-dependent oxidoreductase [Streptomyces johnsoniae]|uniref:FAD-dependent oxidoreductase n=1 Tax=Streptomyces johnsoniae TaxID=3075532 RepID=A0ABU2S3Z9_9ACTN|nr:FAD-dependent oxidoreductase [Streptomyces sp. DSM 41886]MDT0442544.1 FAD-dependent oxidoreductase [Streptomyces sp. DSM 41886]